MIVTIAAVALCWTVNATPVRVIDGDTVIIRAPIWLEMTVTDSVRLLGVNAPEMRTPSGPAAKAFSETWLANGTFTLQTCGRDKYGRILGVIRNAAGESLGDALLRAGHAVPMRREMQIMTREEKQ